MQADGAEVETIEGASDSGRIQQSCRTPSSSGRPSNAASCSPGMLLTAAELLARNPCIRHARRSGPSCRAITVAVPGYEAIIDAVEIG